MYKICKNTERSIKGRGADDNPRNRFRDEWASSEIDSMRDDTSGPRTQFITDHADSILVSNNSPDIPFRYSINPYRGCEHGCVYCYARPTHEYLGFSSGLDFESKIMVKHKAPELLKHELSSLEWEPEVIAMSGVTDCYQPAERKFRLTRKCLQVLADFRNPVVLITKNYLVTRDIDLLTHLSRFNACKVAVSVTTLDGALAQKMEPRTSQPHRRLEAIKKLSEAGIPVAVMVAPVIPGLNDHEIPGILEKAANAGAVSAGHVVLRLPYGVKDLFEEWLHTHFPDRVSKVLNRIRSIRNGDLNSSEFGERLRGTGPLAAHIHQQFSIQQKRFGLNKKVVLSAENFRPLNKQLSLF